jgi:NADP-dependent 3-hydroxy acid dehydrogenase YdfG/uncharacterized protein YciI
VLVRFARRKAASSSRAGFSTGSRYTIILVLALLSSIVVACAIDVRMLAIVTVTHTARPDEVAKHADEHRAYLRSLRKKGTLIASGPIAGHAGGMFVLRVDAEGEARAIAERDPFNAHGVARHDVRIWTLTLGAERFEAVRPLEGRVALVTGASSGIGEATAIHLARAGASVALVARRAARLSALASRLEAEGAESEALPADVTEQGDARALVDRVRSRFGRLDIVVNGAGVMLLAPISEATPDEWRRMVELNLLALMHVTQAALPVMRQSGGGHIVNVASLAGRVANPGASAYAATKFGVVGFSESVRREVFKDRIRVTVIEPGVVATELGDHIVNAKARQGLVERLASMEPLRADDVAAAILYAVTQPAHVNVNEIVVRPTDQER